MRPCSRSFTAPVKRLTTSLAFPLLRTMATSTSSDLESWFKSHTQSIYEAQSDNDLVTAFEATFSPSSEIFLNHEPTPRESFKSDLVRRRESASSQHVEWDNVLTVSKNDESPDEVRYHWSVADFLIDVIMTGWYRCWVYDCSKISQVSYPSSPCTDTPVHIIQRKVGFRSSIFTPLKLIPSQLESSRILQWEMETAGALFNSWWPMSISDPQFIYRRHEMYRRATPIDLETYFNNIL